MDLGDIEKSREKGIADMQQALDNVESVDLPYWLLCAAIVPVAIGSALSNALRMIWAVLCIWFNCLGVLLKAPGMALYMWVDISLINLWYLKRIAERMSEK